MKIRKVKILKNEKGVTIVLEQIFILLFGILLLVMIITVFTALRGNAANFVAGSQFKTIASYVHNGVLIAVSEMDRSDSGKIFLDLPDKVGDTPYRVLIQNNGINVTDLSGVLNASVNIFSVNATVSGNVSSGAARYFLSYNRSARTIILQAEERVITS